MNQYTFPILRLLSDGRFHSGEEIASQLGITRATVWNALQDAGAMGVKLFSVRGRGYRLPEPIEFLNRKAVLEALGTARSSIHLELHEQLESTNTTLMKQAGTGVAHGTCVAATLQTQGRGRRGRTWHAGLGSSLTFSLLWRFDAGAAALSGLSLAAGVALIRAFREMGLKNARLKWPNDVLVEHEGQHHKLAGMLIELQGDMEGPSAAVIGVGINLHLPDEVRGNIDQAAIGMQAVMDRNVSPNALLGAQLRHLSQVLGEFGQGGFGNVREEWLQYHAYHEKPVRLILPDGREIRGMAADVAEDGVLLVETPEGLQRFASGEISLRGAA